LPRDLFSCPVPAKAGSLAGTDQGHLVRLVVADLLGRDVEPDDAEILGVAGRLAEACPGAGRVQDPV
jgi:hypothetical protein